MKNIILTATITGAIISNAFGAASIRTPQFGGTTATPNTTGAISARAGTLRAQTVKTASTATPTTSIATPIFSETTDTRLPFFSNKFSKQNTKTTDIAKQQDLNSIDERIKELQSKLDTAEAAQSTVLTEDTIDAKIEEKLTELGQTSNKDTYSKAEVDALLKDIIKKLPQVDDKGNISLPIQNATTSARLLPYYLYDSHGHGMLGHSMTYRLYTPHDFGIINWPPLAQEFTSGWVSDICAQYQSDPNLLTCGFWNANGTATAMTEFKVARCDRGFYLHWVNHWAGFAAHRYETYENLTQEQLRNHFCGDLSNDLCWISDYHEYVYGPGGCISKTFYINVSDNTPPYYYVTTTQNDGGLEQTDHYNLTSAGSVNTVPDEWVTETCAPHQQNPSLLSCGLGGSVYTNNILQSFGIVSCYEGFHQVSTQNTEHGVKYDYVTFENLTQEQILHHFCDGHPNDECWLSNYNEGNYGADCVEKTFTVNIEPPYYLYYSHYIYPGLFLQKHYFTTHVVSSIPDEWVTEICAQHQSDPNFLNCILRAQSGYGPNQLTSFSINVCYEGFYQVSVQHTKQGVKYHYVNYENLTEDQLRDHFCGDMSNDECWISILAPGTLPCNVTHFEVNVVYPTASSSGAE